MTAVRSSRASVAHDTPTSATTRVMEPMPSTPSSANVTSRPGQAQEGVQEQRDAGIQHAAEEAGGAADDDCQPCRQHRRRETDEQRRPAAKDDPREGVASELIGAQQVGG